MCVPVQRPQPLPAAVHGSLRSRWSLFDLVCFGLLIKHGLCFVGGASQSGAPWLTPPRVYSSPPQVCTEPLQSQQSFARDSHPPGGTITRGFQHCWEEFSPNLITIHKEPVCRHNALLLPVLSCSNFASCHMKFSKMREKKESRELRLETQPVNKKLSVICA